MKTGSTFSKTILFVPLGLLVVVIVGVFFAASYFSDDSGSGKGASARNGTAATFALPSGSEILRHRQSCTTPCDSVPINFWARFRRGDVPIRIYYPNGDSTDKPGTKRGVASTTHRSGKHRVISLDSTRLNSPIEIFEVIKVK